MCNYTNERGHCPHVKATLSEHFLSFHLIFNVTQPLCPETAISQGRDIVVLHCGRNNPDYFDSINIQQCQ